MRKVFRSRIGWEIWGPFMLLIACLSFVFVRQSVWIGLVVLAVVTLGIAWMALNVRYIIDEQTLYVKCPPFVHIAIDIDSIWRIEKTLSPLSSPAASLIGRMEVHYRTGKSCIISPKEKIAFIRELRAINSSIVFSSGLRAKMKTA